MSQTLDLHDRIQRNYKSLRRSEQIVADYLRQNAGQRLDHSITDLARLIGVSEATVSRVSKALGFAGYPDMKLSIAAGSNPRDEFLNIPKDLNWTDDVSTISRKLAGVLSSSMLDTQRMLEPDRLQDCIDALYAARRVVFIGVGGAGAVCDEAAHILLKIGIEAVSYSDGYTQTIAAATLKPDCVLVAISHTGATPTVVSAVQDARKNGITTIAITGDRESELGRAAEILLATSHRAAAQVPLYGDFLEGRICQLFLIDVLYLGLMFRLDSAAKRSLESTTEALAQHFSAPSRRTKAPSSRPSDAAGALRDEVGGATARKS